ncbi:MAG: hypothetical protein QMD11_02695 [Smithella sp.]|nr:hypothetical protein [Smithella sp.]
MDIAEIIAALQMQMQQDPRMLKEFQSMIPVFSGQTVPGQGLAADQGMLMRMQNMRNRFNLRENYGAGDQMQSLIQYLAEQLQPQQR